LESTKDDAIALRFDQAELEQALAEADVEAHGLREKALVLTAVAATAAGVSGQAAAMTMGGDGATAATAPASALISDVVSGGPAPTQAVEASGGGGGISISAPQAWETGLAGGLTLLVITGAGFAAARHRHQRPAQA